MSRNPGHDIRSGGFIAHSGKFRPTLLPEVNVVDDAVGFERHCDVGSDLEKRVRDVHRMATPPLPKPRPMRIAGCLIWLGLPKGSAEDSILEGGTK